MEAKIAMQKNQGWLRALGGCAVLLGGLARPACAEAAVSPQTTVAAEIQSLARGAGVIFVGQIVSIEHLGGVVAVTFRVEQPVAGPAARTCTLREWAGLWPPGHNRYLVGQRALAFLHTPGPAGLSSPVNGPEGLVPVLVQGADAPELLDIRRLAAAILRSPGTPLPTADQGAIKLQDALTLISTAEGGASAEPPRVPLPARGVPPRRLQPIEGGTAPGSPSGPHRPIEAEVGLGGADFATP